MSLAWTTVALLIFLLPGFFTIVGFYSRIPREAGLRSPFSQIAASIFMALILHGFYYIGFDYFMCCNLLPCIDIEFVFSMLQVKENSDISLHLLSENFSVFRGYIVTYLVSSGVVGYGIGVTIAQSMRKGWLPTRGTIQHEWISDLLVRKKEKGKDTVTFAYILTRIEHAGKILMYRGSVKDFFASADGVLTYLVLSEATRYYMRLDEENPSKIEEQLKDDNQKTIDY